MLAKDVRDRDYSAPMQTALEVLRNTPIWVFAILAYLIWQGVSALGPQTRSFSRCLALPFVFILWGLFNAGARLNVNSWSSMAGVTAFLAFAFLGFYTGAEKFTVDSESGFVTSTGSPIPLVRNLVAFTAQYAYAVAKAFDVDSSSPFFAIDFAVSGASTGYFIGWLVAFIGEYWDLRNHKT